VHAETQRARKERFSWVLLHLGVAYLAAQFLRGAINPLREISQLKHWPIVCRWLIRSRLSDRYSEVLWLLSILPFVGNTNFVNPFARIPGILSRLLALMEPYN
jgi:hypothetical protein